MMIFCFEWGGDSCCDDSVICVGFSGYVGLLEEVIFYELCLVVILGFEDVGGVLWGWGIVLFFVGGFIYVEGF